MLDFFWNILNSTVCIYWNYGARPSDAVEWLFIILDSGMLCAVCVFLLSQYADQLAELDWFMGVLVFLFIVAVLCACTFPGLIDTYIQMENSSKMNHTKILKQALRHMVCFRILHFCNVPLPQILLRIQFV